MASIYRCGNKRCRRYHEEFEAMSPADAKLATGRGISCVACGQVVWWVRQAGVQPKPQDGRIEQDG